MSDRTDDMKATAESLIADTERLKEIEERKLELDADDAEAGRLSSEGSDLAREMDAKARLQDELSDDSD